MYSRLRFVFKRLNTKLWCGEYCVQICTMCSLVEVYNLQGILLPVAGWVYRTSKSFHHPTDDDIFCWWYKWFNTSGCCLVMTAKNTSENIAWQPKHISTLHSDDTQKTSACYIVMTARTYHHPPLVHFLLIWNLYTGFFTTLGHNCRRWFPRFLWSKMFI